MVVQIIQNIINTLNWDSYSVASAILHMKTLIASWERKRAMGVIPYLLLMSLTVLLGYIIFRVQVRNDYKLRSELSPVSTILEILIFAVHANLPYTFLHVSWPALPALPKNKIQLNVGLIIIVVGFAVTLIAMSRLGFQKALGRFFIAKQETLK